MDSIEIGVLTALAAWITIISNPVLAYFTDHSGPMVRRRLPPIVALCIAGLFPLFTVVDGFSAMFLMTAVVMGLYSSLLPLTDTMTMAYAERKALHYGSIRVWGSLSFVVTLSIAGRLFERFGTDAIMPFMIVTTSGLAVAYVALIPAFPVREPKAATSTADPAPRLRFWELFKDKGFTWFIVAVSLGQSSHGVYYTFATLNWRAHGLDDGVIGILWSIGVSSEMLLFWAGRALMRRVGGRNILLIGCGAGVVRWIALAFIGDPWLLAPFQALHGATFALTHLAAMNLMTERVDSRLAARAQGLYAATATGAVLGLSTLAAGPLFGAFGGYAYLFSAGLSALASGAAVITLRHWR